MEDVVRVEIQVRDTDESTPCGVARSVAGYEAQQRESKNKEKKVADVQSKTVKAIQSVSAAMGGLPKSPESAVARAISTSRSTLTKQIGRLGVVGAVAVGVPMAAKGLGEAISGIGPAISGMVREILKGAIPAADLNKVTFDRDIIKGVNQGLSWLHGQGEGFTALQEAVLAQSMIGNRGVDLGAAGSYANKIRRMEEAKELMRVSIRGMHSERAARGAVSSAAKQAYDAGFSFGRDVNKELNLGTAPADVARWGRNATRDTVSLVRSFVMLFRGSN